MSNEWDALDRELNTFIRCNGHDKEARDIAQQAANRLKELVTERCKAEGMQG